MLDGSQNVGDGPARHAYILAGFGVVAQLQGLAQGLNFLDPHLWQFRHSALPTHSL